MANDGSIPGRTTGRTVADLLRQMFDTVSARPTPPELIDLVDQLDAPGAEAEPENKLAPRARLSLVVA